MGCLEQKFIREEKKFEVVVVSHWLQVVVTVLLPKEGGVLLFFSLAAEDKIPL